MKGPIMRRLAAGNTRQLRNCQGGAVFDWATVRSLVDLRTTSVQPILGGTLRTKYEGIKRHLRNEIRN